MIGEALVDLVPDRATGEYRATPGGSPFNVAVGLARLGNRTSLMARFADDRYGRLLRGAAAAEGIDLRGAPRAAERSQRGDSPRSTTARGATYEFEMDGTADWQWTAAELRELSPETEVLHFGSIASWTPPGAARIADLVGELRAACRRGDQLRPERPARGDRGRANAASAWWSRACARAHVVKASREDIEWLYPGSRRGRGRGPLEPARRRSSSS